MNQLSDVIGAAYRAANRPGRTPEQIADAVLADPSVNAGLRNPGFLMRAYWRRLIIKEHKCSVRTSEPTMGEVERDNAQGWSNRFGYTVHGELCTEESLKVLHEAEAQGYTLGVEKDKTFTVTKSGKGTCYLRSNSDIQQFAKILPCFSEDSSAGAVNRASTNQEQDRTSDGDSATNYLLETFLEATEDSEIAGIIRAAFETEYNEANFNEIVEAKIFEDFYNKDRDRLGDDLTIGDIVTANARARIIVKCGNKETTEAECMRQLEAAQGKSTDSEVKEAELFGRC